SAASRSRRPGPSRTRTTTASNSERSLRPERQGPIPMSLRDDRAAVLAGDPRYSIHAYIFVFEALEFTKNLKKRPPARPRGASRAASAARHVSGRELCEGARLLALEQYGLMALTVLALWG